MSRSRLLCTALAVVAGSIVPVQQSVAGPLTSAEVTKIINHVSLIEPGKSDHPAEVRDVIKDDLGVQTGTKSRSELLFQDNTLTRLGAETFFSFKTGTRDMTLERGSMLLQVPKGLGGAKIQTAAVTAAITGTTIMMEYFPHQYIKVLVLEGSLRLSPNGSFGNAMLLESGKMVIMRPDAKVIPEPVDIDLTEIVKTSPLINFPGAKVLPSMGLIQAAITQQQKELAKGTLIPTNLLVGHGTRVVLANSKLSAAKTGSAISNVANGGAAAVNNLLGSGPAVSVSDSTQLLSLVSNAVPGSGGTITVSPPGVTNNAANATGGAGGGVVSGNNVPVSVSSAATVSNLPVGGSTSTAPTSLLQPPIGSNPLPVVGGGQVPSQAAIGPPPGH